MKQLMATDPQRRTAFDPLNDIHPRTGASIEVFYADRALESFGRRGAGWFWWYRRRGFSPESSAAGPFPTTYAAYRDAMKGDYEFVFSTGDLLRLRPTHETRP